MICGVTCFLLEVTKHKGLCDYFMGDVQQIMFGVGKDCRPGNPSLNYG